MFKSRWLMVLMLFVCLPLTVGCPKKDGTAKTDDKGDEKPKFSLYRSGVPKYDNYFQRVYKLRYKLWKSDRQIARIPTVLRSLLDTPGDAKKANIGELLKAVGAKVAGKVFFKPGLGIRLNSGVKDPNAQKVAKTLDQVYQTVYKMPKNLGGAVDQSKKLLLEGQRLTKSVPKDFTGLRAMKAPGVTAALADSTKSLGKVPGQVAHLSKTSVHVAKQFPAVFRSKK